MAAALLITSLIFDGRALPALATAVLLLSIGERGECLGWINGYAARTHPSICDRP